MRKITRRQFLRFMMAGTGALLMNSFTSGCMEQPSPKTTNTASVPLTSPEEQTPIPAIKVPELDISAEKQPEICTNETPCITPEATKQFSEPSQPTIVNPDLVIARNGDPEDLVIRVINALGGMERFVKKGEKVIIKPNICTDYHSYEYAATTNPWVVGAIVKLCLAAGASRVQVMDFPFGGTAKSAYVKSGIQEQVERAGGEMLVMPEFKFVDTPIPEGKDIKSWIIFEDILKADVVINVPIAKHHSLARLTLGMKNLMGVIQNRSGLHRNLGQRLADLTSLIRPTLTIVDAVRILTANGPTGGNLDDVKKIDTVIASPDIVAADAYATTLFGLQPEDISYIVAGNKMGLGNMNLDQLKILEV